jgi:hypothetical protein
MLVRLAIARARAERTGQAEGGNGLKFRNMCSILEIILLEKARFRRALPRDSCPNLELEDSTLLQ